MKKAFNYSLFAIVALSFLVIASPASAQTSALLGDQVSTSEGVTIPEPLSVRKAKAETELQAIYTQFNLFTTRTQLTIDRLATKDIDTTKAQAELTASKEALADAKTTLDLFTAIVVVDTTPEQDTTELKTSLKKIEETLKLARTHLIESLLALKAQVTISIDAQQ